MDKITAFLAPVAKLFHVGTDKVMHLLVMFCVALANVATYRLESILLPDIDPAIWVALNVSATVAILKEAADWMDNQIMLAEGHAPIHGVELADVLWGLAGGLAVCLVVYLGVL